MLVNFVIVLTVLMGCCGLALDVGMLELKNLQLQSAADAAALGAMLDFERNDTGWQAAGKAESAQNGYTDGSNHVTVAITSGPAGFYSNDYSAMQAVVSQTQTPLFMGVLRAGNLTPTASAIAQAPPCAYIFATLWTASNGLSGNCPLYVGASFTNDGFASTHMSAIRINGAASASTMLGNYSPTPYFNYPAYSDPLAWITSPAFHSCTYTNKTITTPTTLNPNTYCGGITITNTSVTLNPGLYIITGGQTWSGATVTGTGVTLFMTTQTPGSGYGQFQVVSNSVLNLSAPTDSSNGGVPGVLVFADRNWVETNSRDFRLDYSSYAGDGIWYLVNAPLYIWANNMMPSTYLGIVAQSMYAFGSTIHLASNYSNLPGGTPYHPRGTLVQ